MPTPLENDPNQANLAGSIRTQQTIQQFTAALRQATPAVQGLTTAARGVGMVSGGAMRAAGYAGYAAYAGINAVAQGLGSPTSSFIERRIDWALFGAGTTGSSILGRSLTAGLNAGDLSYSQHAGLTIGQTAKNAVAYNTAKAVFQKTGLDPLGVQAIVGGEEATADVTGRLARYGAKITPQFREWYMQIKTREADREIKERQQVGTLAAAMFGRERYSSSTPTGGRQSSDDKLFEVLNLLNGTMQEIKASFMGWLSRSPSH